MVVSLNRADDESSSFESNRALDEECNAVDDSPSSSVIVRVGGCSWRWETWTNENNLPWLLRRFRICCKSSLTIFKFFGERFNCLKKRSIDATELGKIWSYSISFIVNVGQEISNSRLCTYSVFCAERDGWFFSSFERKNNLPIPICLCVGEWQKSIDQDLWHSTNEYLSPDPRCGSRHSKSIGTKKWFRSSSIQRFLLRIDQNCATTVFVDGIFR